MFCFIGENLVPESPLQMQETSERKGYGPYWLSSTGKNKREILSISLLFHDLIYIVYTSKAYISNNTSRSLEYVEASRRGDVL